MSYSRPSASAANLSWVGQSTHTRPSASAANLGFAPTYAASGWKATTFGTPSLAPHAVGWRATNFGTALAVYNRQEVVTGFLVLHFGAPTVTNFYQVSGFTVTQFGAPRLLPQAVGFRPLSFGIGSLALGVTGWKATTHGTPTGRQFNRVTTLRPLHFGTSFIEQDATPAANGWLATSFGDPVALRYAPADLDRVLFARWTLLRARFGTPTVHTARTCAVSGFKATTFGSPGSDALDRYAAVSGFATSHLGTPTATVRIHPIGWVATVLGSPRASLRQVATGFAPVHLGTPAQYSPYTQYGWLSTRMGHPQALRRFNKPVSGFRCIWLGSPAVTQRQRVSALIVMAQFGTPQLHRSA